MKAISAKTVLPFASEADAMTASFVLGEAVDFENFTFIVRQNLGGWTVESYDDGALAHSADVERILGAAGLLLCAAPVVEPVPDLDWVSLTQTALPPVRAGRFVVHGTHDRCNIVSKWAIEIEAGRAFGTAHHASTRGCLMALDRHLRRERVNALLDIGTGSGILAIAAIKALHHRCWALAIDNDPVAIEVARKNCRENGVAAQIDFAVADGRRGLPCGAFDLITANILAQPLIMLSGRVHDVLRRGGLVILSGFLSEQSREVNSAYIARGFAKVDTIILDGWTTAVLRRIL